MLVVLYVAGRWAVAGIPTTGLSRVDGSAFPVMVFRLDVSVETGAKTPLGPGLIEESMTGIVERSDDASGADCSTFDAN